MIEIETEAKIGMVRVMHILSSFRVRWLFTRLQRCSAAMVDQILINHHQIQYDVCIEVRNC